MQIKMIVIQNRNNQSLWGKTTSWFKMFEINIIHNNHLDLACVCVCGQKRHTNDRLQVNRISRSTTEKHLWPQMTHKLYPQDDWFEMVTNNVVKNNMFWWRNMCKKHNIHNNHLDLMGVRVCGQKRHTQRIDCRPAKSHERLHVGTCGHRQHTISNRVNACGQKRHTSCDKNNWFRSSRIKPVRRDTVIFAPSVCSNLSSHSHRTISKTWHLSPFAMS